MIRSTATGLAPSRSAGLQSASTLTAARPIRTLEIAARCVLAVAAAACLPCGGASIARAATWDAGAGGGNLSWSTFTNWSDDASPSGQNVIFDNTGGLSGTAVTNIVDSSFTINSLNFRQDQTVNQTMQINSGVTLNVNGSFTPTNGAATAVLFGPVVDPNVTWSSTTTITGNGALTVTNTAANFLVGFGNNVSSPGVTVNMAGLASFSAAVNIFGVGREGLVGASATRQQAGILRLAQSSTITARQVSIGDTTGINGVVGTWNNGPTSTLFLAAGGTASTIINTGTMSMGVGKAVGNMQFNTGVVASDSVIIRGTAGGSTAVTTWDMAYRNMSSSSGTPGSTVDFGAGKVDAIITNLNIARWGATAGGNNISPSAAFTTGSNVASTITVTTVNLALGSTTNAPGTPQTMNGTLTVNGGTFSATTVNLATGANITNLTRTATLNVDGGVFRFGAFGAPVGGYAINLRSGTISSLDATARSLSLNVTLGKAGGSTMALGQTSGGTGPLTLSGSVALADTTTLTVNTTSTISGPISGASFGLVKGGAATLTLSGSNSYTGTTAVNSGTLAIAASNALPSAAVVTVGTGTSAGFLTMVSTTASVSSVTLSGTGSTVSGGRLNLVTGGSGTPLISVGTGSASWSSEANLVNATTVNVGAGAVFTMSGAITGAGLTKLGSGTLALVSTGTNYASTSILGGYAFAPSNTLGSGTVTIGGGAILDLQNSVLTNAILFTTGSGSVINSGTFVNLSGTGTILSGTGATITTNYNVTSSGSFVFANQLAAASGTSTATVQVQSGAFANLSGGVGSTGIVTVLSGGTGSFTGAMAGSVNTSGISTFGAAVTGNVSVNGGTATFNTAATGAGSQVNVYSGTAVFNSAVGGLAHAESGTATVQINGDVLSTADINANNGGTVILAGSGTFGSPNIDNAGTVIFNRTGNLTLAATITGTGGVTKNDGTLLNLTGNSDYTGPTAVNSGTLAVNGSLGNTALSVAAAAWLQGSGTIAGDVNVLGTLSPGNSPGVLTLGSVVLGGSSTTLIEINGLVRGTDYDGASVTGTSNSLTYGGLLSLNFGAVSPNDVTYDIFNFTGGYLGNYTTVTSTGAYIGTWTNLGGSGTFQLVSGGQTLTFSPSTGDIIVVPEPAAVALAGMGLGLAGWVARRRAVRTAAHR
jgi:fibronectin-binding autotransporter adhesin